MRRNFTIYIILLTVCLTSGIAVLLFGCNTGFFKAVDSWFFKTISDTYHSEPAYLLEPYDGKHLSRHLKKLGAQEYNAPPLDVVDFDLNDSSIYSSIPPQASDVAMVINELRKQGVAHLHFSTQFHRESENLGKSLIQRVLSPEKSPAFKSVLIPLQLTRTFKDTPFPSYLKGSSFDSDKVEGNTKLLPRVNKVIFSPIDQINFKTAQEIIDCPCLSFGFSDLESEQAAEGKTPMLALWNDRILVHQLLLSTMLLHDVGFDQLTITMGESIQLGLNKPTIPIDKYGCAELNQAVEAPTFPHPKTFPAHQIFFDEIDQMANPDKVESGTQLTSETDKYKKHVLLVSTPTKTANIQLIQHPYKKLSQLYQTPQFTRVATYYRLPLWLEACLLVEFTLLCALLYRVEGLDRQLGYALLIAFLWPLSALLMHSSGYWIPISPIFAVIFMGWAVSLYLSSKWKLRRSSSTLPKQGKKELARFD